MDSIKITFGNAKTRFGWTVMPLHQTCLDCGTTYKRDCPQCPRPKVCSPCARLLGCWVIMQSYTQGSGRCFELHPDRPERYRTKKEAQAAKKALGL